MSTNSAIGIVNPDGTIRAIYANWDGYPAHNGEILANYYTTNEKINALLDEGDVSVLGVDIGSKHDFDALSVYNDKNLAAECTFYHRDRDEQEVDAIVCSDRYAFHESFPGPYYYLFENGEWVVSIGAASWKKLSDVLSSRRV